jgi:hypothetical protein
MAQRHRDYSSTPLSRKLGIRDAARVVLVNAPAGFASLLEPLPAGARIGRRVADATDVIVVFVTSVGDLERRFRALVSSLAPDGRLWIAWPKRTSTIDTDLTFRAAQQVGLSAGLVDNKSASITDVFQGLQFVYRLKDRPR